MIAEKTESQIFLIHENAAMRRAIARVLAAEGFSIATHASSQDLVEQLPNGCPTCTLIGVSRSDGVGPAYLKHLFDLSANTNLVVVCQNERLARWLKFHSNAKFSVVSVPIDVKGFVGLVRSALGE